MASPSTAKWAQPGKVGLGHILIKNIYISPHADDVALSCGGQIIANAVMPGETMVLTAFTSERQASGSKAGGKLFADSINSFRTAEDRAAWRSLGIAVDYLDLPEALLRNKLPFSIIGVSDDQEIVDSLCLAMRPYIARYPEARFHFPAGFGNHIDHLACQQAALRLLDEGSLDRIVLYEDIPYCWLSFIRRQGYKRLLRRVTMDKDSLSRAFRPGGVALVGYLRRRVVPFPRGKPLFVAVGVSLLVRNLLDTMRSRQPRYEAKISLVSLNNDIRASKKKLLLAYESQIPMLFSAQADRVLNEYAESFATEATIEISRMRA